MEWNMSRKGFSKVWSAVRAGAPVLAIVAGAGLLAGPVARGDAIWVGGTSGNATTDTDWEIAANWLATGGEALPPGDGLLTTPGSGPVVDIGNNGTVNFSSAAGVGISRLHIGYDALGIPNGGTGVLNVNAGVINMDQDSTIGDGADGTLNINGGTLYTKDTKHTFVGASANGTVNLTSGNLYMSRYGLESGPGYGVFNMSGGTLDFIKYGGNPVTSGTQVLVDYFSFSGGILGGGTGIRTGTINAISGSGDIHFQANTGANVVLDLANDSVWHGTTGGGGTALASGDGQLTKTGPAQLTIDNVQGLRRFINVNGGTLVLDYALHPTGLLDDNSGISLGGGTLRLKGSGSPTLELIGTERKLESDGGGSTVLLDPNGSTIELDTRGTAGITSISRTLGTTVDFSAAGNGAGGPAVLGTDAKIDLTSAGVNGVLQGWTVNGATEWASNSGGVLTPLSNYSTDTDLGTSTAGATANMRPTGVQSDITTAQVFNSINLTGAAGINMTGAGSLALTSGGLIGNTTGAITGGTVTAAAPDVAAPTDLVIATPADLSVSSAIIDNGSGQPVSLTKTGAGVLTISGANTYSGSTFIDGGTLKLASQTALPLNTGVVISNTPGAALDLNGINTTLVGLTGGGDAGGEVKLSGANLTINNSAAETYAGIISGAGNLIKQGSSDQTLAGANTYTGTTTISGGTLWIKSLANGGLPSSLGASTSSAANLVIDGGTLRSALAVTSETDRLFTIGPSGATLYGNGNPTANQGYFGALRFMNTGALGMTGSASARKLTLDADGTAVTGTSERALNVTENRLSAIIPDSGPGAPTSVLKQGIGLWYLSGASTYTGSTQIDVGVLRVNSLANGGSPSSIGASSSAASNLVIDGGTLQYVGAGASTDRLFTLNFSGTLDSSGSGPINFSNTGALGGGGGILTLAGTNTGANTLAAAIGGSNSISKTGDGTWILTGPQTYTGPTTVDGGLLAMQSNLTTSSGITVSGGTLQLAPGGGSNRVIVAPTPAISNSGKIDLADNKMIVTTAGETGTWNGTAYDGVSGLVQSARGDGSWNGTTGITSSSAASNANPKLFSIGVVKVGDLHAGLADTDTTTFAGQTVHGSDTIAMYTYGGDANLDGKINIDDYGLIDSHVGQSGTAFGWHNGDFNYDGKINIDDYGIIDGNIGAQGAPIPASAQGLALSGGVSLGGVSAVPEPGSLAALSAMALLGVRRRRRLGQPAR
jgi:fibronectin-binding autotransporter adhesin